MENRHIICRATECLYNDEPHCMGGRPKDDIVVGQMGRCKMYKTYINVKEDQDKLRVVYRKYNLDGTSKE